MMFLPASPRQWRRIASLVVGVAFCTLGASAQSEDQLQVDRADEWFFNIAPYAWLAGINGDVTIRGFETDMDVGFDEILDVLDFGAISHFEAGKGKWSIVSDLVFLQLTADADPPLPAISDIDFEMEAFIVEVGGKYRVYHTDSSIIKRPFSLFLLGGARYTHLDANLDIESVPPTFDREGSQDWIDPFIGFHSRIQWTKRWASNLRVDIGGFGVGSDFAYQIASIHTIALTESLDLVVGFRSLTYDYEEGSGADEFEFDATMSGPILGLNIGF